MALLPSAYAPAVGGVEELTARLAVQLVRAGDDVQVWTIRYPVSLPAEERIDGIDVRRLAMPLPRLDPRSLLRAPYEISSAFRQLLRVSRAFRPDLVHVQCFSANGVYAAWLARRLRVPLIVTLQGETVMDDMDIYERSLTLRASLRIALRQADAVTACSRFVLADAEQRFGLPRGRGSVIPNGVEFNEGVPALPLDLPFKRFVLTMGRVVAKKGFDLMLDAFVSIARDHPEVGLVIGGSGPARDDLVRRAAEAGLAGRVSFPGVLSRGEIAWAMGVADVFVLPSRVEPFGIVVLEALRAGCPVVVSGRGGAPEIVRDGIDGLIVDPVQIEALSASVDRILTDKELAQRLSTSGRSRAAEFDWHSIAARYRDVYQRVAP
ncbi:MAG: glycosyltransferase family 4 protein [Actinomycetota bacterium]|nr:glycosyltransferase family 4 protein [Actinomycetota bacterium]